MRTYIFTERERRILNRFVVGEINVKDRPLSKILSRIRTFKRLASDVELYTIVRSRLAESESAVSA